MKRLLFIFLFFTVRFANAQINDKYDALVDSLSKTGQTEKLIPYFEKEVKAKPKDEYALRWLGYLYIEKNELELGEKSYRQALAVNPKCGRCYLNLGRIYAMKGDFKKSTELLDQGIATTETKAELYNLKAKVKVEAKDKIGALMDFNKAIELDPKNVKFLLDRASYNLNNKYTSIALADIDKALEMDSSSVRGHQLKANIYFNMLDWERSLASISKAIQLDSNESTSYFSRASIYLNKGDYGKAINDFSHVLAINPKDFSAYQGRATARYKQEDMDAACLDFSEAYKLANIYASDDQTKKDIEAMLNPTCDSTKPSYFYQRGIAYYNLKNLVSPLFGIQKD